MSFRDKLAQRNPENNPDDVGIYNESEQAYIDTFVSSKFFGVDNLRNAPACIDLRLKDFTFNAVPYSYIVDIFFNPSEGIEILTNRKKIKISGRNLKLLYEYLTAFRVRFIEANIGNDITDEKLLFVKDIEFEETEG